MAKLLWRLWRRSVSAYWLGKSQLLYKAIFFELGTGSRIIAPLRLETPESISVGKNVTINRMCWLGVYPKTMLKVPRLTIGSRSTLGNFNHITCVNKVAIGEDVLIADKVHISDNSHIFSDINVPIKDQGVCSFGEVEIGQGTWIGEGASILSAKVGRNCVIGANAVVTRDIPDFCIAVGVPAKVIKKFNVLKKVWEAA